MRNTFIPVSARRLLLCVTLAFLIFSPLAITASTQPHAQEISASPPPDPDKPSSEMNHHIAGLLLLVIGVSVIASERYQSLASLRWLPAILFVAAGLFLAAWSDNEIWPRGNLGWSWLVHHDAEARQHKLYALLLIAVGSLEAIQASSRVRRRWLVVVLPVLCVTGGTALLFHQHSGEVAASTVKASSSAILAESIEGHQFGDVAANSSPPPVHQHGGGGHHESSPPAPMVKGNTSVKVQPHSHEHGSTGAAAKIQREHLWFAVVGFCIAFFKLLHDAAPRPVRIRKYLWASSVVLLGLLLLLYTE